jgi:hypothetical protein
MDRENILARQFPLLEAAVPGEGLAEGALATGEVATLETAADSE